MHRVRIGERYLGFTDILHRWIYTRRGLEKLAARKDFPAPAFTINNGRNRVWDEWEIQKYEYFHPEVLDPAVKHRKVAGYAAATLKKKARSNIDRPHVVQDYLSKAGD